MPDEGADPLHIHAPYGSLGHPDHLQHIYGHLFPDRKDELVAKLNSRYGRALEFSDRAEPEIENGGFGSALRREPSERSRADPSLRRCRLEKRPVEQRGFEPLTSPREWRDKVNSDDDDQLEIFTFPLLRRTTFQRPPVSIDRHASTRRMLTLCLL